MVETKPVEDGSVDHESDSSSEGSFELPDALAMGREKRLTAGNRLRDMLNAEIESEAIFAEDEQDEDFGSEQGRRKVLVVFSENSYHQICKMTWIRNWTIRPRQTSIRLVRLRTLASVSCKSRKSKLLEQTREKHRKLSQDPRQLELQRLLLPDRKSLPDLQTKFVVRARSRPKDKALVHTLERLLERLSSG